MKIKVGWGKYDDLHLVLVKLNKVTYVIEVAF